MGRLDKSGRKIYRKTLQNTWWFQYSTQNVDITSNQNEN